MKKQKKSLVLVLIFMLIFVLAGCEGEKRADNKKTEKSRVIKNEMGNTSANLANSGLLVEKGRILYFASAGKLYKKEGDTIKKLCEIEGDSSIGYVNVSNGWIYFWGTGDEGAGVYKVKEDGSDFQRIVSDERGWSDVWVIGNDIYYDYNYKMEKDGSDKIQIGEKRTPISLSFNISDGYMYYCAEKTEGEYGIFSEKLDGTDLTEIYEGRTDYMIVEDGWIFFVGEDGLCKMKIDGTEIELLAEAYIKSINIKDDWIYYNSTEGIFKVKTDGTENQMLYTSDECDTLAELNIAGDWLYYRSDNIREDEKEEIYRAKLDGSKHEVFFGVNEQENLEGENIVENQEKPEENLELNNTYQTRFGDVNMITFPKFAFDFPSVWNITEEVTQSGETVTISNERGVKVTYSHLSVPVGKDATGGSAVFMTRVEASKVEDSNFIPSYVQGTDYSNLGKFVVAKLSVTGEMDMKIDSDFKDVNGSVAYAVIPESLVGVDDSVRNPYCVEYGFKYGGGISFIAEAPEDGFTKEEEKCVIEILKSFRVAE